MQNLLPEHLATKLAATWPHLARMLATGTYQGHLAAARNACQLAARDLSPLEVQALARYAAGRAAALLLLVASVATAADFRSYHVGNSLTWDSRPSNLEALPTNGPYTGAVEGHHIRCGNPLDFMVTSPTSVCVTSPAEFGTWQPALSQHSWDAVTFQPFTGSTGAKELAAIQTMLAASSSGGQSIGQVYVLQAWPGGSLVAGEPTVNYPSAWGQATGYSPTAAMQYSQQWWDGFMVATAAEVHGVRMIPTGEVLLAIDAKLRAGEYPELGDVSEFYRDQRHLNNVGRYTALLTMWSTIHGISPFTLPWDYGFFTTAGIPAQDVPRTEALSNLVRSAVWETVVDHPWTGVTSGDFNRDGVVNLADYTVWRDEWQTMGDYTVWQQAYTATRAGELGVGVVPEPSTMALVVILLLAVWPRRKP